MKDDWDIETFISSFENVGYKFESVASGAGQVLNPYKTIYLRHDVDFSLAAAVRLGHILRRLGITSCFFLMITSPLYSLFARVGGKAIQELIDLGHDLQLHFDPSIYDEDDLERKLFFELETMKNLTGQEQKLFSFHRPSKNVLRSPDCLFGIEHTYMSKWMQEIAYFSDSRGEFRFGHPAASSEFKRAASMQLLLHPEWWCCSGESRLERVEFALNECKYNLDIWAGENCDLLPAAGQSADQVR